jgi:hypothetical protein
MFGFANRRGQVAKITVESRQADAIISKLTRILASARPRDPVSASRTEDGIAVSLRVVKHSYAPGLLPSSQRAFSVRMWFRASLVYSQVPKI